MKRLPLLLALALAACSSGPTAPKAPAVGVYAECAADMQATRESLGEPDSRFTPSTTELVWVYSAAYNPSVWVYFDWSTPSCITFTR